MLIGEGLRDHEAVKTSHFQAKQGRCWTTCCVMFWALSEMVFIVNVVKTRMWENENADPEEMERYASVLKNRFEYANRNWYW